MNEDSKLDEAEYFLRRITETATRHPTVTRYELSACLSAARSALQYARKEAQDKDSQPWDDGAVSTADPSWNF